MKSIYKASIINGLTAVIGFGLLLSPGGVVSADAHGMGGYERGERHHGMSSKGGSQCPVADKFLMKSHFLLENKTDLGLTDDQVKTIKALKLQVEKTNVTQNADKEIFMLDINSKLMDDKVDVEGAGALIDKGFAAMAQSTKSNLDAYAKLKALLTPEQLTKMKDLWKNKESEKEEREEKEGKASSTNRR